MEEFSHPFVLAEGSHWFALYKPPFWEVTVDAAGTAKTNTLEKYSVADSKQPLVDAGTLKSMMQV